MYKIPKKYYVIIAAVVIIFFSGITINYLIRKNNDIKKEFNSLSHLSEIYKYKLINWLEDKKEDSENILKIPYVKEKIYRLLIKDNLNKEETANLYSTFENLKHHLSFRRISIFSTDLKLKLSTSPKVKYDNYEIKNLNKISNLSKPTFSDFELYVSTNKLEIDLLIPIFSPGNKSKLIGIFMADLNPKELIDSTLITIRQIRNKTGEYILTKIKGDKIIVINKLRHVNNEPLKMNIKPLNTENDFYGFIKNNTGNFLGLDYRNKRILSVVNNVPGFNWKIISKIDEDEILSPLKKEVTFQYILSILLIFIIWLVLKTISKKRESDYYQKKYLSEKEKKEAEARILLQATAMQSAPSAIIITDENGDIEWCNRAFTKMTGYKFDESLGKRLINMIDIDSDYKELYENINKKINVGETWSGELKNKTKKGEIFYTETSITPFYDEVENKTKFITVKQDITEKKIEHELLKESEARYKLAAKATNDIIYDWDSETHIINFSENYSKLLKCDPSEIGNNFDFWISTIHPEDRARVIEETDRFLASKDMIFTVEYKIVSKDGSIVHISEKAIGIRDKKGKILKMVGAMMDVTKQKETELILTQAKKKAEQSNKLKSDFLAQMSHEIRTPINAIINSADIIRTETKDLVSNEVKQFFPIIDISCRRIIRTINLILNMSEIQTGSYEPEFKNVDLKSEILPDIFNEQKLFMKDKVVDHTITYKTDNCKIKVDSYSLKQIFSNLLNNAIKFTPEGKIECIVDRNKKGELAVKISDTGIGIEKEFLPHLFEVFTQEKQGYSREFEGNGLGLALVKEYCKINNAKIKVKSKKGVGTTFTITFKS